MKRFCLTFLLSTVAMFAIPCASIASESEETFESELKAVEAKVFLKEYSFDSAEKRIKRLEIMLFPGEKLEPSMSLSDRLDKIGLRVSKREREKAEAEQGLQSTMLITGARNKMLQTESSRRNETSDPSAKQRNIDGDVILIMLDCSYSMKESITNNLAPNKPGDKQVGSFQKMDLAKDAVLHIMRNIPSSVFLGLRTYGAAYTGDPFMDCKQSSLVVPPGKSNRRDLISQLREIHPYGMTPLEYALRQAAEKDLRRFTKQKTIILISDGGDTCGGNPCEFIKQLPRMGVNLKVYCIGLGLRNRPDDRIARNQLYCIAKESDGAYLDVSSASQMIIWLSDVLRYTLDSKASPPESSYLP